MAGDDPDATQDLPASDQVVAAGALDPGQLIGRFVVKSQLGEGGMGVVLAGLDADLGRPVAIKLVREGAEHPAYRARLLREAQAMARLEHPNVVRVYEVGSDRGRLFVAMELVDGVTLTTWLKVQRRPWREVVALFEQIGAGLAAVHRVGLVHRDFKPDNVLVDRDGRARVADFGLARMTPEYASGSRPADEDPRLTHTGMMMGTPGYMAPEQQFGGAVDARADQYSFCVALREALLGGRPANPDDVRWGGVPRGLRAAIARGLAYDSSERYASMDALLAQLRRTTGRRRQVVLALLAGVVVAGGAAMSLALVRSGSHATIDAPVALADAGGDPDSRASNLVVTPILLDAAPDAQLPAIAHGIPAAPPPRAKDAPPPVERPPWQPPLPTITGLPPDGPLPPAANPTDPGHLAVVRATIRELGYDGFDPDIASVKLDELGTAEQGIALVKVGMLERKQGRCDAATSAWTRATKSLTWDAPGEAVWDARAYFGLSLCALASGRGAEALETVGRAWGHGNQDEIRLVMAVATYETGERETAHSLFKVASGVGNPKVQAAIREWIAATGLTL